MICAVCCGTKRLTEIACPADCGYLGNAREHPAAVVRRQQERDAEILMPTLQGLTERQYQLFFLFSRAIAQHRPEGFTRLVDDDVAEAASALAATLETAMRGVIYEHTAQSRSAQRLVTDLQALLNQVRQHTAKVFDREAAIVLRAIEKGARDTRGATGGGDTAYLTLIARLLQEGPPGQPGGGGAPGGQKPGSLIVP
jgi:hypothetical protein